MKRKIILMCFIFSCLFAINCFAVSYTYNKQEYSVTFDDVANYPNFLIVKRTHSSASYDGYYIIFSQQPYTISTYDEDTLHLVTNRSSNPFYYTWIRSESGLFPLSGNLSSNTDITFQKATTNLATIDININNSIVSGSYYILASNYDVVNTTDNSVFFKPSAPRILEEILKEEPQQIQEKIWETLKTIVPVMIVVFSTLLLVWLIRYHLL